MICGEIVCSWKDNPLDKEWHMSLIVVTSSNTHFKAGDRFKMGDFLTQAKIGFVVTVLPL